jgi:peptide/nickel transport system substrate-binding protein
MMRSAKRLGLAVGFGAIMALGGGVASADTPKRGGTLTFVVPDEPPSYDGHRETTFAAVHPIAPFYSTLIRVPPENPSSSTEFVCDVCVGDVPEPTEGGRVYTFELRDDVKFHDGQPMTSADVKATFDKIIFDEGQASARRQFFEMVDSVEAPDDHTIVFNLEYPSTAFLPALANPFNYIYQKAKLDEDPNWYQRNVLGTGPFKWAGAEAGSFIRGERYDDYHFEDLPYLDGFEAIFARKQSLRVQAIRGDRAAIEFRGFPPKSRDDLVRALGDDITVQESDWNCVLMLTPNQGKEPFNDVRVREALSLALDRWGGSEYLSQIAIVKTVGGLVFPGHPLAATREELEELPGYGTDVEANRARARELLKEAGAEGLSFTLTNRGIDQPYTIVGTWLIDQWREIGLTVDQRMLPTGPFYASLRERKDFDAALEFNCQANVNPVLDVSKFMDPVDSGSNYGNYSDPKSTELYLDMARETDPEKQREKMRTFERHVLADEMHSMVTLWWYRIIPHRTYVKGWYISPSHYLGQDLSLVWLDK